MVVDGQAVFRSGLARLLGEDDRLEVVAVSEGGPDVPELCAAMSVDVVVTDLRLPKMDGIELIRMISAVSPSTKTLVVASAADWGVVPAIGSGRGGFPPQRRRARGDHVGRGRRAPRRAGAVSARPSTGSTARRRSAARPGARPRSWA